MTRLLVAAVAASVGLLPAAAPLSAQSRADTALIPLGTTRGERANRLVIRNALVVSGRGTPGSNRAMPAEGPIDIVIEGNPIVDYVPVDPVNLAGYGRNWQRPTGDRVIDATGMYVTPGLVDMHAHLPGNGGALGARALDYAFRLYLGHGVTTVRDAGTGAGLRFLGEQRRLSATSQTVAPRLVLPGILTVMMFSFTLVMQEFVYALTFITSSSQYTVSVGVPTFLVRGDVYFWCSLMGACLIVSLPVALLYNVFLDRFVAAFTVGAVK